MAHHLVLLRRSVASSLYAATRLPRVAVAGAGAGAGAVGTDCCFSTSPRRCDAAKNKAEAEEEVLKKIKDELKAAIKGKQGDTAAMLKTVLSDYQYAQKQSGGSSTPASILSVLRKSIERRTEAAAQYASAKREDLADKERAQGSFLCERFLPKQMEDEELRQVVGQAVQALRGEGVQVKKVLGMAMKSVKAQVEGRADGKRLKEAIEEALGGKK